MPDGSTEREGLESVERQTGNRPAKLDGPELPDQVAPIWQWFMELASCRSGTGFGGNPIGYPDIVAWSMCTGTLIRPHEVSAVLAVDRAWMAAQAEAEQALVRAVSERRK